MKNNSSRNILVYINKKLLNKYIDIEKGMITFLNPYSYLLARSDFQFISDMDYIGIDGGLLAKLISRVLHKVERLSFDFSSIAGQVFSSTANRGGRVYIVGSTAENIELFIKKITEMYPDLIIAGYRDGFFANDAELQSCIENIIRQNTSLVVVGMGAGLQEQFLSLLKAANWNGVGYTCGGFIHQIANTTNVHYYPDWINQSGLRWAYRIYDEPKLIKRYLIDYGKFMPIFLWDSIIYKINNYN